MSKDVRTRWYCSYRWRASRTEAPTAPVEHVCARVAPHDGDHWCACGAATSGGSIGRGLCDARIACSYCDRTVPHEHHDR